MLPTLRLFATLVAVHALAGTTADAQAYYVSQHGDDATGDGSDTRPWRTITHALRVMPRAKLGSRNTLTLGIGYWYADAPENFPLRLPHDVHLRGEDRTRTVLAGRRLASRQPLTAPTAILVEIGVVPEGSPGPLISGLSFEQSRYAVQLRGGRTGGAVARVEDCSFETSTYAIQCTNGIVDVDRCRFARNTGGIQIANVIPNRRHTQITRCRFLWNGVGISLSNALAASIRQNRFDYNSTGVLAGAIGALRAAPRLENNVYYKNGHGLMASAAIGATIEPVVRHETFCENAVGLASLDGNTFGGISRPDIANCVIWGSTVADLSGVTEDEIRHSSFRTAVAAGLAPILGRRGMISVPPRFEDPASGNLRIRNDSGLINRGTYLNDPPTTDVEGEPRRTDHPDLGADEVNRFLVHARGGSRPGELRLFLDAPNDRGRSFYLAASTRAAPWGGIRIDKRRIPIQPDALLAATAGHPAFSGRLNGAGQALVRFTPDAWARRSGTVYFVFITVEGNALNAVPVRTVSNVVAVDLGSL